ncbi:hypothetical protein C8J57DRAFT_1707174 [Mycena rebaudengoi]|nr:hypothetical protein C8J57DRAFT_1707174 [Mycena rebaudengoi]
MATTMRRPSSGDLVTSSRAAQRKQRLIDLENEQRLEDAEALKFTEEQRLSLFHSFRSVKFEWSDLDGMRPIRRRYNSNTTIQGIPSAAPTSPHVNSNHNNNPYPRPPHLQLHEPADSPTNHAFAVLTNAHLASFGAEDTICLRRQQQQHLHQYARPATPSPYSQDPAPPYEHTAAPQQNKVRSPVKGLFSGVSAIHIPLPPFANEGDGDGDDDDDAWEDEDDDEEEDDEEEEEEEDDDAFDESALPTPVAPLAWRFADALDAQVDRGSTYADAYSYRR